MINTHTIKGRLFCIVLLLMLISPLVFAQNLITLEIYNQPIVDCMNATVYVPVIVMKEANETKAYLDGNCIFLESTQYSVVAMKDRILYAILGVVE